MTGVMTRLKTVELTTRPMIAPARGERIDNPPTAGGNSRPVGTTQPPLATATFPGRGPAA
ncbi:MAG: hypothetical protein JWN21_614 [Sphingomonas bacterium]|nr:hypothetical protein [Sphingomonas bacterium]